MARDREKYRQYDRARYQRDKAKRKALNRRGQLRRAYGITPEEYDALLAAQGSVCAVCGRPPKKNRLAVDHEHVTGRVRGLLCIPCNWAMGVMGDDMSRLLNAVSYLRRTGTDG